MSSSLDVLGIGNAIVDTIARAEDDFLVAVGLSKGAMALVDEARAFAILREALVNVAPVTPQRRVLEDQIVWGRSPLRLDLAGGWTDTPPYCLEFGGKVVNVAVDLNGQPPIQVFVRVSEKPELVIRSIDIGVEERVQTYEQLATFDHIGSG